MRNRIWNFLADVKFKSLYTYDCYKRSDRYYRYSSIFIAFTSASSITAWTVWKNIPFAWASLVATSQVLIVAMPYLPFLKNDNSFREMSFAYDSIYLEVERLWYAVDNNSITYEEAEKQFYKLREQALKIEKEHKNIYCPEIKSWIIKANEATDEAIKNQFYLR